jgi:hypothetical protein
MHLTNRIGRGSQAQWTSGAARLLCREPEQVCDTYHIEAAGNVILVLHKATSEKKMILHAMKMHCEVRQGFEITIAQTPAKRNKHQAAVVATLACYTAVIIRGGVPHRAATLHKGQIWCAWLHQTT